MKQLLSMLGLAVAVGGFTTSAHADPVNVRQAITSDVDFATDGLSWFLQGPGFVLASDPSNRSIAQSPSIRVKPVNRYSQSRIGA